MNSCVPQIVVYLRTDLTVDLIGTLSGLLKSQSVSPSVVSEVFTTPWTVTHQTPLPREFSRQEYWSRQPFLSPGDLPDPGIKPRSPILQADSLLSEPPQKLGKEH